MEQEEFDWKSKSRGDQIFARFERFHIHNPDFWHLFCKFTDRMRQVKPQYAVASIFERARWELDLITTNTDDDSLKLNNDFKAYYARMYLVTHPNAKGFFELRKLTSQNRSAYKDDVTFHHSGSPVDEEWLMQRLKELADDA